MGECLTASPAKAAECWSVEAMQWACGAGIVGGYTDAEGKQTGYLGPKDDAQRAQAAAMLQRLDAAYGIL